MVHETRRLRIAVIGAGISGNVAARLLSENHDVELFEAQSHAGGHAETVQAQIKDNTFSVDMGFMVFNDRTYPEFRRFMKWLQVSDQPSDMSFSVQCEKTGLEYQGSSLNGLFAQRRNLISPRFYKLLGEIMRFNRLAILFVSSDNENFSIGEFLQRFAFSSTLVEHYLIPMTAAIWSAPPEAMTDYPAKFLIQFLQNHGLLQIWNRPQWYTIAGGSKNYVAELLQPLFDQNAVHLNTPIKELRRTPDGVLVHLFSGETHHFDLAVVAVHADQALQLLADASQAERDLLGSIPYQPNLAVLHTDASLLPTHKRAWASWNYHVSREAGLPVSVTYDVNRLQQLGSHQPILVTLNPNKRIDPALVIKKAHYQHPLFTSQSIAAQGRWREINGEQHTYFCGAYWGHGFHEDGVKSALAVCRMIEQQYQGNRIPQYKQSSDFKSSNTCLQASLEGGLK